MILPWSLDVIIDDYARLMDALGGRRFHLAGAKIGGVVARVSRHAVPIA